MTPLLLVGPVEDFPPGVVRAVEVDGHRLALVNAGGEISALDGTCPHAGGPLGDGEVVGQHSLRCPWHGAVFDVGSGEVLEGPATHPVRTYSVTVQDGLVWATVETGSDRPAPAPPRAPVTPPRPPCEPPDCPASARPDVRPPKRTGPSRNLGERAGERPVVRAARGRGPGATTSR
ncbi:MAG: Rieske (2Fe-2S) protein [Acidimicrobiales bacterium]